MKLTLPVFVLSMAARHSVFAGQNCKCQASDGTGPQDNAATGACCMELHCTNGWEASLFPGENMQCDAQGTNCLDSGAFVDCCKEKGAPSAYCWD